MAILRHTLLLVLALSCIALVQGDAAAPVPSQFNAYEYFAGEWDVYRHIASYRDSSIDLGDIVPIRWRLEKENNTANLFGRAWVNGTNEYEGSILRIEFPESTTSGAFQAGQDEDSLTTLFDFTFTQSKGSLPISVGAWQSSETQGEEKGAATYVFQAATQDRFTIVVTPRSFNLAAASKPPASKASTKKTTSNDDDEDFSSQGPASTGHPMPTEEELANGESFIFVGQRVKVEVEKTFFQKFGTMGLLACMLILNVYMRTRQANPLAAAARANIASAAQRPTSSKKSGPKIEEITDEDTKKGQ